jgi:hypothetical protein
MAAAMFALTRVVPRVLPSTGPRPLTLAGAACLAAGLALLTRLQTDSGYWTEIAPAMVLLGVGVGLGFVPLTPVVMGNVDPALTGVAGGVLQTSQQLGASLGVAVLVTVFGRTAGVGVPGLVTGMTTAFTVATVLALATMLVAGTFRRTPVPV